MGVKYCRSDYNPCNGHLRDLATSVANGIREAGGLPMEAPVFATGECCLRPTAMMYRNLCSMDVEEICRANPVDGMVLLVGCDKVRKYKQSLQYIILAMRYFHFGFYYFLNLSWHDIIFNPLQKLYRH